MGLRIELVAVPPFMENTYVVADQDTKQALILDPGGAVNEVCALIQRFSLTPTLIFCTHAHIDHVAGVADIKRRFNIPLLLHIADQPLLEAIPLQSMLFGFPLCDIPTVDRLVTDGEQLKIGECSARIIHTPGHTPGGLCLYFSQQQVIFTGDTLFAGAIGRTDTPGGSYQQIVRSIEEKLFTLDEQVVFYPGHGPQRTIGEEKRSNPYI